MSIGNHPCIPRPGSGRQNSSKCRKRSICCGVLLVLCVVLFGNSFHPKMVATYIHDKLTHSSLDSNVDCECALQGASGCFTGDDKHLGNATAQVFQSHVSAKKVASQLVCTGQPGIIARCLAVQARWHGIRGRMGDNALGSTTEPVRSGSDAGSDSDSDMESDSAADDWEIRRRLRAQQQQQQQQQTRQRHGAKRRAPRSHVADGERIRSAAAASSAVSRQHDADHPQHGQHGAGIVRWLRENVSGAAHGIEAMMDKVSRHISRSKSPAADDLYGTAKQRLATSKLFIAMVRRNLDGCEAPVYAIPDLDATNGTVPADAASASATTGSEATLGDAVQDGEPEDEDEYEYEDIWGTPTEWDIAEFSGWLSKRNASQPLLLDASIDDWRPCAGDLIHALESFWRCGMGANLYDWGRGLDGLHIASQGASTPWEIHDFEFGSFVFHGAGDGEWQLKPYMASPEPMTVVVPAGSTMFIPRMWAATYTCTSPQCITIDM